MANTLACAFCKHCNNFVTGYIQNRSSVIGDEHVNYAGITCQMGHFIKVGMANDVKLARAVRHPTEKNIISSFCQQCGNHCTGRIEHRRMTSDDITQAQLCCGDGLCMMLRDHRPVAWCFVGILCNNGHFVPIEMKNSAQSNSFGVVTMASSVITQ